MKTVRVGVIGVGGMGSTHARMIAAGQVPGMTLAAVCDIDESKLQGYGPDVKTFTDSKKLIRSGDVDAVIVATPHYGHTTIGIDAMEQGLHLLTEKPISVHKADAERLIAARKNKKQVFAAMFNMRTDPYHITLRDLIQSGQLGQITRINWIVTHWYRTQAYYDNGGWRATWKGEGGGVLLNQCPHNLDLWQWFFGMPKSVRAFCGIGKYHTIEVEDDVTAYMEYANGATGVFVTTTGEAPGTGRLEIAAENGRVILENGVLTWKKNTVGQAEFCRTSTQGFAAPGTWDITIPVYSNGAWGSQHCEILKNFTNAILNGEKLIAPAEEGIRSVELANAMLYSSFTGKTVDMPLSASAYETHLKKLIKNSTFKKKSEGAAKVVDMTASFKKA